MIKVLPIKPILRSSKKHEYIFEFILTRRCNLNCKNCARFASFYDKTSDISFEEFKKDFDHILKFPDFDNIKCISLSGGEPTIVKDFIKIVEYIRSNFKGILAICTNCAKILTFSESELERLKNCEVSFSVTKYPISNINYEKVFQILDCHKITYERFKDFGEFVNDRYTFAKQYFISKKIKHVFRKKGHCCAVFLNCYNGNIYPCANEIPGKRIFKSVPLKEFKSVKEVMHYILNDHSKDYFCERCLKEFTGSFWEVDKDRKIDFYFMSKKEEEYYCE